MAVRNPLVIIGGQIKELPLGDAIRGSVPPGPMTLAYDGTVPNAVAGSVVLYVGQGYSSTSAVPVMTSATAPSGVVSASTAYSTTPAYVAFAASGNGWITNGSALPQWLQYQFPTAKTIGGYSVAPWDADTFPTRCPKNFELQGSNNGSTWVTLDAQTNITTWVVGTPKMFAIATPGAYLYYRLYVTANGGDSYMGCRHFSLFEGAAGLWAVNEDNSRVKIS